MRLSDLIDPSRIVLGVHAADKAQALGDIAKRAGTHLSLDPKIVLEALGARERLGSTGFGRGFALPHVRLAEVTAPFGLLVRLARPIEFDAIDGKPVDILFALLMPLTSAGDPVAALAAVSRHMRDESNLGAIRKAGNSTVLFNQLQAVLD